MGNIDLRRTLPIKAEGVVSEALDVSLSVEHCLISVSMLRQQDH